MVKYKQTAYKILRNKNKFKKHKKFIYYKKIKNFWKNKNEIYI